MEHIFNTTHGFRVLAVDDDPDILEFIKICLEDGMEVITLEDGNLALNHLNFIEPDLLILDSQMPVISGLEFCTHFRNNEQYKNTPVIMLSIMDSLKDIADGYKHGATLYLTKPIEPESLRKNVELELFKLGGPQTKQKTIQELTNILNLF